MAGLAMSYPSAPIPRIFVKETKYEFLKLLRTRSFSRVDDRVPGDVLPAVWRHEQACL